MFYVFIALLAPFFDAITTIMECALSNRTFKHPTSMIFYISIMDAIFVPLVFIFGMLVDLDLFGLWLSHVQNVRIQKGQGSTQKGKMIKIKGYLTNNPEKYSKKPLFKGQQAMYLRCSHQPTGTFSNPVLVLNLRICLSLLKSLHPINLLPPKSRAIEP